MRSIAELAFRARQEAQNLFLLAYPPEFRAGAPPRLALPEPEPVVQALRGSAYAAALENTARDLVAHRFPIFGRTIETGPEICWRRDYVHGIESDTRYFRRVPYLHFDQVGDHKFVWELNRHQHLVLLAQAFLFTQNVEFAREIFAQIESWWKQNPFPRGINWASALEVAFRALSWIWVYHLTSREMPADFRQQFLKELYRHGRYLAQNLSIYFSPNTHLLGEAVALFALGTLFREFPESAQWCRKSRGIVESQLAFQVRADGSHFEQSTYYHVYALDFFLFFYLLAGRPESFRPTLIRMAEYLHWLLGPARRMFFLGDDDGGRVFHPYGERDQFGRATLATCAVALQREWPRARTDLAEQAAWWLGAQALTFEEREVRVPSGSRLFPESGTAFLQSGELFVEIDCGGFGHGKAGHSHSDTLSLLAWFRNGRLFDDPGTYSYVDKQERERFRGSAAHNTVRINGLDQAEPAGPFGWRSKPIVTLNAWEPDSSGGRIDASCEYSGFKHRRQVLLEPGQLLVLDEIAGPPGEHVCEQIWQLGDRGQQVQLSFSAPVSEIESSFSPVYGTKRPGSALVARVAGRLPIQIAMLFETGGSREITIEEAQRLLARTGRADKIMEANPELA